MAKITPKLTSKNFESNNKEDDIEDESGIEDFYQDDSEVKDDLPEREDE